MPSFPVAGRLALISFRLVAGDVQVNESATRQPGTFFAYGDTSYRAVGRRRPVWPVSLFSLKMGAFLRALLFLRLLLSRSLPGITNSI